MDDSDAPLVLPFPSWLDMAAVVTGMFIAYLVLGVLIFRFADRMRQRRDEREGRSVDILTGDRDQDS